MKIKGYRPNKVSIVATADIPAVASIIKRIEKRDGAATPRALVQEARSRSSVLHKYFTWDLEKAAEKCWLNEAQQIIRAVCYRIIDDDGEEQAPMRAFVAVHAKEDETEFEGRGYISVARAMKADGYRDQIVHEAFEELTSWRQRYEQLKMFSEVFQAIDRVPAPA